MSDPISVVLTSKRARRAQTVQRLNHVIPAAGLLWAGLQAVAEGAHGFEMALGVFEIVSAGALIVLTMREIRGALRSSSPAAHHHQHHHHAVDWVDVAAGLMLGQCSSTHPADRDRHLGARAVTRTRAGVCQRPPDLAHRR